MLLILIKKNYKCLKNTLQVCNIQSKYKILNTCHQY